MLNVGGLVHYSKGQGGVVLCNLRFQETERVPINAVKKRAIIATVLRNLKAPFAGGKTIIAGADLEYRPIDIHTKATTYKDERGWFGDRRRTLKALPAGEHVLAGVRFSVYEMPTSPVPQVLMLAGRGVPGDLPQRIEGIPIDATADALFFLQAARVDRARSDRERREGKQVEIAKYVIRYAEGPSVEIPVRAGVEVDHWIQREPRPIAGAQVAWTAPFDESEESAVLYSLQWNNPRPETPIASVDLLPGRDGDRGVPALIAITAVRAP
jgi:beta-galactosidase